MRRFALPTSLLLLLAANGSAEVIVGSKMDTEGHLLAEMAAQVIQEHAPVKRKFGMGGTGIVYQALKERSISLYPEYTGTIQTVLIKQKNVQSELGRLGLVKSESLGFNNTYAIAVQKRVAQKHGLQNIEDLKNHPELVGAFSREFIHRPDGLKKMLSFYGFDLPHIVAMEHSLAYEAIRENKAQIIDVYSTDSKIKKFDLVVLKDTRNFFPEYAGVWLATKTFTENYPKAWAALKKLEGKLSDEKMMSLNSKIELEKIPKEKVASAFLNATFGKRNVAVANTDSSRSMLTLTFEHLYLVFISLFAAILVGVPLGILATRTKWLSQSILVSSGVVQTIPSLALLCFLIPLFGIGSPPALIALFLYALLPIVRSTYSGILTIDKKLREVSQIMGLSSFHQITRIEMPLASVNILSGIKTSAVINVGTATLAALIGAGGYGTLIVSGLALNDIPMIMSGAIPAACLAIGVHFFFEGVEKVVVPTGLKKSLSHSAALR